MIKVGIAVFLGASQVCATPVGMNIDYIQPTSDWFVTSMPFTDIFRTARPFKEFSKGATFDIHGWPLKLEEGGEIKTHLLMGYKKGIIPSGTYTVRYTGKGVLHYGGTAKIVTRGEGQDIIDIDFTRGKSMTISMQTLSDTPIKDIEVIMPPLNGQDFTNTTRTNVSFYPPYLDYLKGYSVIRTMNFQMASPHVPKTCNKSNWVQCVQAPVTTRVPSIHDATWGASFRTPESENVGAPIEVSIRLAHKLKADLWYVLPPSMTNHTMRENRRKLSIMREEVNTLYVEYANEAWNGIFLAHHTLKAINTDKKWWQNYVDSAVVYQKELVKGTGVKVKNVLGGYYADLRTARLMMEYARKHYPDHFDVFAVAPYFQIPWEEFKHMTTTDEVFEALQDPLNLKGLKSVIELVRKQATQAKSYGLELVAYEAGQHLTIQDHKDPSAPNLTKLIASSNHDKRMGELYTEFLEEWSSIDNTGVVTMFSMPQQYTKWGAWGTREYLSNPPSPKDNAIRKYRSIK